jgi:hypothetical protein
MPKAPTPAEICERYEDYKSDWREIREERKIDMRYVGGDPWDPAERRAREGRPTVSPDELTQFLNQAINNIRQNKRAIQVTPKGYGANDKGAQKLSDMIRGIEYQSKAQQAYITAYENALQGSYGFARLLTKFESEEGEDEDLFNQILKIVRVPNPDNILFDPGYKEADASDVEAAFVLDLIRKDKFQREGT